MCTHINNLEQTIPSTVPAHEQMSRDMEHKQVEGFSQSDFMWPESNTKIMGSMGFYDLNFPLLEDNVYSVSQNTSVRN